MAEARGWDRRSLLRGAAVVAGAAAAAPLLGATAAGAQGGGGDADALFRAGRFERAGRAYEEILRRDPANLHAARQRGYIGLLGNRFPEAEEYLTTALRLDPGDRQTNELLADCHIRQDAFSLSVPRWRAAGETAMAEWFAAVPDDAYRIHGDVGRVPWTQMDPEPQIEASLNGGPPKRFTFYTGASWLGLSARAAEEAGVRPVYREKSEFEGRTVWSYYGVLDSFGLGGIELRGVPVAWSESEPAGGEPPAANDGMIGTWVFYHLLTTFDYRGRELILRRPTPEAAEEVRAAAARAGAEPLPLWLARDHYVHSQGSIAGSGTRVVGVNLGGRGEAVAGMPGDVARELGVRTDHDRPIETGAQGHPAVTYPCYPAEIRLGDAVAEEVYCETNPDMPVNVPWPYGTGIDSTGWFAHAFFKPYNVTLDFTGMNVYIVRGKAS
ncbi:tetratricopeptide repeat protein [Nocardiopsis changdeensis]|uniref:Tetratricopeptide repeat protein n=1 Tax=Nocardiopsis changdeensis TaxID=2831969 RepID=A0ABX8BSP2_9ACTN|nr:MULTISPECIES: tetratricopeptide repeat protein [Nocardiopsis]QUX25265.1 tetratricopeptide repeat protein [Nocardiopsis changdeensis]QYX35652.1 tetratricopeptide repeat protein [Nocardiopsis sp. MT53]